MKDVRFDAELVDFAVDRERRTITGLAVPWGKHARKGGRLWRFERGGVQFADVKRVKLLRDHDFSQALGKAIEITETDEGLVATFQVSEGPAGDAALALAADEVLDGLSIGVEWGEDDFVPDPTRRGAYLVRRAELREISLTAVPAFTDSRLTSVMASEEIEQEATAMPEQQTPETTPAAAPAAVPTQTPAAEVTPAATPAPVVAFTADQFAQFMSAVTTAPTAQAAGQVTTTAVATPERPVVDPTAVAGFSAAPTGGQNAQVNEPLPYRFSLASDRYVFSADTEYDFSTDVFGLGNAMMTGMAGDEGARKRVSALIRASFDVDTTDVAGLMPKTQRPDMWLPQRDYPTPLWDMVNAGSTDGTPFELPKFDSSSGLVSAATEGVEPAPGAFAVTTQTITPSALWGKVEITRHAIRRGGNPQTSGVVYEQMLRSYYEAREAAVATFLATLAGAATAITLTVPTGTYDATEDRQAVADFEAALADLQFVRGGNTFTAMAAHQYLYRLFARVKDLDGRPMYPQLNPVNANGVTLPGYKYIDVAGTRLVGAYALGAATGTDPVNSWLFDPALVRGWASNPDRLEWDFGATVQNTTRIPQLSHVTLGIFGDIAFGNLDINGVRKVVFDPQGS